MLAIFNSIGTAPNSAVQDYLNEQHVPNFLISGASRFNDPVHYPWTMGTIASYETEGTIYGKYMLQSIKDAKIGVLDRELDPGSPCARECREGNWYHIVNFSKGSE